MKTRPTSANEALQEYFINSKDPDYEKNEIISKLNGYLYRQTRNLLAHIKKHGSEPYTCGKYLMWHDYPFFVDIITGDTKKEQYAKFKKVYLKDFKGKMIIDMTEGELKGCRFEIKIVPHADSKPCIWNLWGCN